VPFPIIEPLLGLSKMQSHLEAKAKLADSAHSVSKVNLLAKYAFD
jgi:hypothetical protein